MAVARTGAGTELTMAAFNGPPIPVKMQNMATPSAGSIVARGPKKHSTPNGTVSSADHAETRYSARWFVRSHICASHPPNAVPPSPAPAVIAPRVRPTVFGEKPDRCKKLGIHAEIPPSENVIAAIPSVA